MKSLFWLVSWLCILVTKKYLPNFPSFGCSLRRAQFCPSPHFLALFTIRLVHCQLRGSWTLSFESSCPASMECGTRLLDAETAFCPNKTYIQTLLPRVAFVFSHVVALTPGHLAVLVSIYVKWPEVPLGILRARSGHNGRWSLRVPWKTGLSLLWFHSHSFQWSSAGAVIPTPKRIVYLNP